MSGFTVYGADGRRVERGVAEAYARDLAASITAATGEQLSVVPDGTLFGEKPGRRRKQDVPAEDTAAETEGG